MRRLKQVVVISFVGIAIALLATEFLTLSGQAQQGKPPESGPAQPAEGASSGKPRDYAARYDHFDTEKVNRTGAVDSHKGLTDAQRCEECHPSIQVFVTKALEARPYHDSCVKCHSEQFTSSKMEICASCHPSPIKPEADGTTKFFKFNEDLKQFGMEFSHNTHSRRANWDCKTCHETPADNKTERSTFPDHPECYVCHKENNQPAKGGCNECHNKGAKAELFYSKDRSQIDIAYTYFKFNHGKHLVQPRAQKCEECHDVSNTDANNSPDISRIKLVLGNVNLIHKSLCFKCHNPSPDQAKGETCNKCHAKAVGSLTASPPPGYKKP